MPDFRLPPLNAGERVYRACLHAYPSRFRELFAQDLIETFRDERRVIGGGALPVAAFWLETLRDVLTQGLAERVSEAGNAFTMQRSAEDSVLSSFVIALRASELGVAARRLRRAPGFVIATVLVLGLGLGATTAVFSVVRGVLLKPLPYSDPDQLVALTHTAQADGVTSVDQSAAGLLYYGEHAHAFVASGGWRDRDVNVSPPADAPGPAERISGAMVSAGLFEVLGVRPLLGRAFHTGEDRPGAAPVVVLSERLWRRYFHGDRSAIGRHIGIDGVSREIVGVMPRTFDFIRSNPELWYPISIDPATANVADFNYRSVARLRPGQTIASARADLERILPGMIDEFPTAVPHAMWERAHVQPVVTPLRDYIVGDVSRLLWIVFGSAVIVLAIACANVASLLLVRAEGRRPELAVRSALGSGLTGIMATTLSESFVLAAAGGALGIATAGAATKLASAYASQLAIPRLDGIAVDAGVMSFGFALAVLCAFVIGALPLARARRVPIGLVLRVGGRGGIGGGARQRTRNALVVAQITLGMVLVTTSGLLARSFLKLEQVQPGFRTDGVITTRIVLPAATYASRHAVALMERRLLDAVRAIPGVRRASFTDWVPLTDDRTTAVVAVEDHPLPRGVVPGLYSTMTVEGSYFATMGIPVLAGRTLAPIDPEHPSHEVVVSRAFAERFWPSGSPLGKRIHPGINGAWFTIVGEVADAHYDGLDKPANEAVYLPPVTADSELDASIPRQVALVIDAGSQAARVASAVRRTVRSIDAALPTYDERSLASIVASATAQARVTLALLVFASVLALTLGAVGVYGVMAYAVSTRRREIGVRIALGAEPRSVSWMISRQGIALGLAGTVIGLAFALTVTRVLRGLLFGVSPTDPATLGSTSIALVLIALLASWGPARRAAAVDPSDALRQP